MNTIAGWSGLYVHLWFGGRAALRNPIKAEIGDVSAEDSQGMLLKCRAPELWPRGLGDHVVRS